VPLAAQHDLAGGCRYTAHLFDFSEYFDGSFRYRFT